MSELAALTQDMEARISDQRLEISAVLGSGGYSTVYRGARAWPCMEPGLGEGGRRSLRSPLEQCSECLWA